MPDKPADNIIIKLKNLSRQYGYGDAASYALKDFDLEVQRGEFIMIMGPSGCGKTTLLNIIGLLDHSTSGVYFLNGQPAERISASKKAKLRSQKIGFIFQNFNLIPTLNVLDNVTLPLLYSGTFKLKRERTADAVLERFNLQKREYYMPSQLSGGQQQRVAIARSLINSPELILADEPTGNLDSHSADIVMRELERIHSEGNTIIMVTHNPALTKYATRVINMLDGGIDTDIKTVADQDLPQPVAVRFKNSKRRHAIVDPLPPTDIDEKVAQDKVATEGSEPTEPPTNPPAKKKSKKARKPDEPEIELPNLPTLEVPEPPKDAPETKEADNPKSDPASKPKSELKPEPVNAPATPQATQPSAKEDA